MQETENCLNKRGEIQVMCRIWEEDDFQLNSGLTRTGFEKSHAFMGQNGNVNEKSKLEYYFPKSTHFKNCLLKSRNIFHFQKEKISISFFFLL